jgi:hypothetical protein
MAIQDDINIDVVDRKITYVTAFVNDRPPSIYTVNELYSYFQDTFDEPGFMQHSVPMSAQTPTQYTIINGWFIDDNSIKALYGGSIQTSDWLKSGAEGITQLRWTDGSSDAPVAGDIGVTLTGVSSAATGILLAVDTVRQVAWVRNTSVAQFSDNENVTGTGVDLQTETNNGVQTGETIWANLFSVGSKFATTEAYVGQEDDYQGGRAYHGADAEALLRRKIEKIDEWWDVDVDFATGSPNLLGGTDHIDILVKTREAGVLVDSGRLFVGARQFGTIYSHFELTATAAGNFVVPFASTGTDLNSADGPYTINFDGRTGNDLEIGDILENNAHGTGTNEPLGRLRAVVTSVTGGASATGSFEYYLIGENEPLTTTDRTLKQFADNDDIGVRGDTTDFDIDGAPAEVTDGPAQSQGVTITFGNAQRDINEDSTDEEYACVIDCNNIPLAEIYRYVQFLTSRGNQDGSTPDTQDTLLSTAVVGVNEAGEFYRAVGDITVPWDGKTGTPPAEGVLVTNANAGWTASGVVISLSNPGGASGQLTLTQVKGTWLNDDTVAEVGDHGANEVTVNGTPSSITDNTGAPFGSFAGGRWFVARGIVLDNVPAADANNWQTSDLNGNVILPPTQRSITFAGLVANDRAFLAEVDTPGGSDITKTQNGVGAAGAAVGSTSIPLDTTVALDVPAVNSWVRVVDVSSTIGQEYRFFYTSVAGTTITLDSAAGLSGTATSAGTSTVLNDTGAFATFEATGFVRTGMMIRNVTDGSWAVVLRKIDDDSIETTPLTGGTLNTWESADSWEANTVPVALVDADTAYFPFIDGVAISSSLTTTIKYVADTDLIGRTRFSDPDVGGTRILPFQQSGITLTDANLTVTAIRTVDTIAS